MLNIIGHKSIPTQSELISDKCECCGTENSVKVWVLQKYVFWFWIPFLPAGKTGISECETCKKKFTEKEMSENLLSVYYRLKYAARIPIWMYSGAVLFILLLVYWQLNDKQQQKNTAVYIEKPVVGDVLEVKNSEQQYTLAKIVDIRNDSLFFVSNKYQTKNATDLNQIKDSAYSDEITYLSKQGLKELYQKGTISKIRRN